MDLTFVYLLVTLVPYVVLFAYRKRLIAYISRQIALGALRFAFVDEEVVDAESGAKVARKAVSAPAKALLAALTPVLLAEVAKNVKLKFPTGGGLPAGIDLGNLSEALPALLSSGMVPKKYAGILALAAPFLQGFLGGKGGTGTKPGATAVPKELEL